MKYDEVPVFTQMDVKFDRLSPCVPGLCETWQGVFRMRSARTAMAMNFDHTRH